VAAAVIQDGILEDTQRFERNPPNCWRGRRAAVSSRTDQPVARAGPWRTRRLTMSARCCRAGSMLSYSLARGLFDCGAAVSVHQTGESKVLLASGHTQNAIVHTGSLDAALVACTT